MLQGSLQGQFYARRRCMFRLICRRLIQVPSILCQCLRKKLPKSRAIDTLRPRLVKNLEREMQIPVNETSWREVEVLLRRESLHNLRRVRLDSDAMTELAERVVAELNDPERSVVAQVGNSELNNGGGLRGRYRLPTSLRFPPTRRRGTRKKGQYVYSPPARARGYGSENE
jgi:hypothetical protein